MRGREREVGLFHIQSASALCRRGAPALSDPEAGSAKVEPKAIYGRINFLSRSLCLLADRKEHG